MACGARRARAGGQQVLQLVAPERVAGHDHVDAQRGRHQRGHLHAAPRVRALRRSRASTGSRPAMSTPSVDAISAATARRARPVAALRTPLTAPLRPVPACADARADGRRWARPRRHAQAGRLAGFYRTSGSPR